MKHPDWGKKDLTEDWNAVELRPTLHTLEHDTTTTSPRDDSKEVDSFDWNEIITFEKKFIKCRECDKEFGMIVYQSGTEVEFECIGCYNESVKDGI